MEPATLEVLTDDLEVRLRRKIEVDTGFTDPGRQAHRLKLHFKKFDTDNSGSISFAEFEAALASLNFVGVQEPVRALFDRYDVDASNTLAYQEFAALAVGAKPNPTASAESRSAINQVRAGVAARGGLNGIRSLGHIFRQMDDSGNRLLDFDELRAGLADLGVELSDHDFRTVCRIFDTNGDGLVTFDEFMRAMRGRVNGRRMRLIRAAFRKLDRTGDGEVTLDDLRGSYDASSHPEVRAGRASEDEALAAFLDQFDGGDKDGRVSLDEFASYFKDVSASIDDDDYFELMMQRAWGVSPGDGDDE